MAKTNRVRWIIIALVAVLVVVFVILVGCTGSGIPPLPESTVPNSESQATELPVIDGPEATVTDTQGIQNHPPTEGPMEMSPFALCDLDYDGDCDEADEQIFNDAFGKCRGEPGYNFDADVDGDGCVATNDEQALFRSSASTPEH